MAQTNYINFADYLDINQDEIRRMEEAMRAEEQKRLAEAVDATNAAGQRATEAAYWGEGPSDLMDYSEYQRAMDKQGAAKRWQEALGTDEGQQELLSKLYGGQASALEAGLLFGSQEGGQKAKLGEYMGLDSSEFDRDLNANWANEFKGSSADFQRELAKKRANEGYTYDVGGQSYSTEDMAKNVWRDLGEQYLKDARENALREESDKRRRYGSNYLADREWLAFLSGENYDKNRQGEFRNRLAGSDYDAWLSQRSAGPTKRAKYQGRLSGTRADYEREQREKEEAEQRKAFERYSYGGGYY